MEQRMSEVRWSERTMTRRGDVETAPATWSRIGARVRAAALLAATLHLARRDGVEPCAIPNSMAGAMDCEAGR
jgi:hypothetical protein